MTEDYDQERLIEAGPVETRYERIALGDVEYPEGALKPHAALVSSIKMMGVLDPIRVEQVRRGTYRVKDGLRRVGAVRTLREEEPDNLRWGTIPAIIEEPDAVIGDATRIVGHATRRDNPVVELEVIEHYIAEGYTEKQIAQVTKLPVGTIRKRMKLQNLAPGMREVVRSGKVAPSVGEKMAVLPPDIQERLEEAFHAKGRLTADDVRRSTSVYHESNVQDAFSDLAPPKEEPEPYRTPAHPHEYASALADFLVSMGFCDNVSVPDSKSENEATVNITHPDGVRYRLRVILKSVNIGEANGEAGEDGDD